MRILKFTFSVLTVCGCWRPESWTSQCKRLLYTVYTLIVLFLVYSITFYQFMDILVNVETQNEFADNLYMFLAMMVSCQKIYGLLASRGNIAGLMNSFDEKPFLPENFEELGVRTKYDKKAHVNAFLYMILLLGTVSCMSMTVFLTSEKWQLVFRLWLPYNYTTIHLYTLTYVQQSLALYLGALLHVACDSLICGMLIHINSQCEILGCRLKALKNGEYEAVKSCVRYHNRMYRFARALNDEFKMIIFVQFAVSLLVVCFNLYRLTQTTNPDAKLLEILLYSSCILTQIFIYCWYGNEVKMKSLEISDTVYDVNWAMLDNNEKRILLMIMRRATVPIEFTSVHIASLKLESFVSILKASYSAFNVLQRGQR